MMRRWLSVTIGAVAFVVMLAIGFLAWRAAAPWVQNEVVIQNTSGQALDRVRVRFGGREVAARDLPAGVTTTLPAPLGADGDVRADVWFADGRTAHNDLGGPDVGCKFGWKWVFVVAPPGPATGGVAGSYAPRTDR
jgi:hypothetical protein